LPKWLGIQKRFKKEIRFFSFVDEMPNIQHLLCQKEISFENQWNTKSKKILETFGVKNADKKFIKKRCG
jgi:hypothetical protein